MFQVDEGDLGRTLTVIEEGRRAGLHSGAQLAVSIEGRRVADVAAGDVTVATDMNWLSTTKIVTAIAVGQLWERGEFDLDERVADHVPAFGANGKGSVTIRHLLTHTGGFRSGDAAVDRVGEQGWDAVVSAICAAPLEPGWVPGHKAGYHVHAGTIMLAEIVRLVTGRPFRDHAREAVLDPLGAEGFSVESWPSRSGRGPASALLRVLELLAGRGEREGMRLLQPQTVDAMAAHQRVGMHDHTFGAVMDWGLGFVLDTKYALGDRLQPYGYGRHASSRTFGHSGAQSSVGLVDPEHALAVALVFNGTPGEAAHTQRQHDVLTALYEDLHLV